MGRLARAFVGVAVVCASSRAFAESAQPAQQAVPQPQVVPQQAPAQPAPQPKNAPPAPKNDATPLKKAAKTAPKKQPPAPKAPPKVDSGEQVTSAGDGAPVPTPRCKIAPIKGTALFEARFSSGAKTVVTRLYPSGTFTRAVMKEQKTACIEQPQLAEIRIALKEAPWKTTKSPATCQAVSGETTQIYAAGTLRFTSRTCNPLVLDKLSSHALDLIAQDVGAFGLDLANEIVEGN